jgi:hypothetical protein
MVCGHKVARSVVIATHSPRMCYLHVSTEDLGNISSQQAQASILPGRSEVNADTSLHTLERSNACERLHASE